MKTLQELLITEVTKYKFKSDLEIKKPKSWLKSVSDFANGPGDSIYFGVADDGTVVGLSGAATPYYYSSDGNKIAYEGFTYFLATYCYSTGIEPDFRKDFKSFGLVLENGNLTFAGVFFADHPIIFQSRIFCARWNGLTKGSVFEDAVDDKEFSGNVPTLLENAKNLIQNNSKAKWRKTGRGRIDMSDYTRDAVHETDVNIIIHRDYGIRGSEIHIDIYDDRLEIVLPGGMVDGFKIQDLNINKVASVRRNPVLCDIFHRLKLMERRGSGLRKIQKAYK